MKLIFMASTSPLKIQTLKQRREGGNREKEYQATFRNQGICNSAKQNAFQLSVM